MYATNFWLDSPARKLLDDLRTLLDSVDEDGCQLNDNAMIVKGLTMLMDEWQRDHGQVKADESIDTLRLKTARGEPSM
jgi:hypothetical protein